ncbi:unnamed protein product [Coccothraustes coccothraustes]
MRHAGSRALAQAGSRAGPPRCAALGSHTKERLRLRLPRCPGPAPPLHRDKLVTDCGCQLRLTLPDGLAHAGHPDMCTVAPGADPEAVLAPPPSSLDGSAGWILCPSSRQAPCHRIIPRDHHKMGEIQTEIPR